MRATLHGTAARPVAAVVGAWDPIVPEHEALFRDLCVYSRENGRSPVAVVLEPAPPLLLHGATQWPVYDDLPTRLARIFRCGMEGILLLRFAMKDVNAGAAELFETLTQQLDLSELWVGARQSFGRGAEGSFEAIAREADRRRVGLKRLADLRAPGGRVRQLLAAGSLVEAAEIVGRPPVRSRPRRGKLGCAWAPGLYRAVPLDHPDAPLLASPIAVPLLQEESGMALLSWPDRSIKYLAFVSGPGDRH
jgi:FAD synthase